MTMERNTLRKGEFLANHNIVLRTPNESGNDDDNDDDDDDQWQIQPGAGGHAPPLAAWQFFSPLYKYYYYADCIRWTAGILKWLFVEGFYFQTGLCLPPFAVSVLCIACRLQQQVL